jgi:hypothetical protein
MTNIEELVTIEELGQLGWVTATQAARKGVPLYTVYRWGKTLEREGLARKLRLTGRGMWIISPEGMKFLQSRQGRVGRPRGMGPADDQL